MDNTQKEKPYKILAIISLIALAVLLLESFVFYKEKLFADVSYISFNIINSKKLCIQNQRLGSFVTQMFPLIATKLHLPLKVIVISYVTSFNFFFLAIATILVYKYRQYRLTVVMALFYFLLVSDSFFLANDELLQGVAWMFLMFGVLLYQKGKGRKFAVLLIPFIILGTLALSTHFIAIIPTIYVLVYLILEKKNWPFTPKQTIGLSLFLIIILALKFGITAGSQPYETEHLHNLFRLSISDIFSGISTPIVKMFFYRCATNYWLGVIAFVLGLYQLFRNKQKLLASWCIISFVGYFLLMGVIYPDVNDVIDTPLLCHLELEWQCVGIIFAMPFVMAFLPTIRTRYAAVGLALIFVVRLAYIHHSSTAFTWRTEMNERLLIKMRERNINKLAFMYTGDLKRKYKLDWSAGYETMLISSIEGDMPMRIFTCVDSNNGNKLIDLSDTSSVYLYGKTPIRYLDRNYFTIDTTHPYLITTYEEFFK